MTRTIVIGDIHGCFAELCDLFDRVALADDDHVISVGDLVDRGPEPGRVVAWFRARVGATVLMGNHERKHIRGVFSYAQEITRLQLGAVYEDAVAWMRTLPYFYESPQLRVVHAAMVPNVPLVEQDEDILCGSTSGEERLRTQLGEVSWHERYTDDVPLAFGHHVVGESPLIRDDRVFGLDTGACHGLALTALVLPERRCFSVRARADHWRATKRAWQVPVLRTRPWTEMSWTELEAELTMRARTDDDAILAYVEAMGGWVATLQSVVPTLEAQLRTLATTLTNDVAAAHPAKAFLFAAKRGHLDAAMLAARLYSPAKVCELARALGYAVADPP